MMFWGVTCSGASPKTSERPPYVGADVAKGSLGQAVPTILPMCPRTPRETHGEGLRARIVIPNFAILPSIKLDQVFRGLFQLAVRTSTVGLWCYPLASLTGGNRADSI